MSRHSHVQNGAAHGAPVLSPPTETVRVTDACTACGACLATCPERALRRAPKRPHVVDAACTACWACIEICPAGAIEEAIAGVAWQGPAAPWWADATPPARRAAPGRRPGSAGSDRSGATA